MIAVPAIISTQQLIHYLYSQRPHKSEAMLSLFQHSSFRRPANGTLSFDARFVVPYLHHILLKA